MTLTLKVKGGLGLGHETKKHVHCDRQRQPSSQSSKALGIPMENWVPLALRSCQPPSHPRIISQSVSQQDALNCSFELSLTGLGLGHRLLTKSP